MRIRQLACGALLALAFGMSAQAQDRDAALLPPPKPEAARSPSDLRAQLPPDLVMHLQEMQRYADPQSLARGRAIEKAKMRQARIGAAKWYGYSPLRPPASPIPTMGNYYPVWHTDVERPARWYYTRSPGDELELEAEARGAE